MICIKYLHKFFLLIALCIPAFAFAQEVKIETSLQESNLEALILDLEKNYDLLFSYKEDDIKNIRINPPKGKQSLSDFLSLALNDSGLSYEIVNGNYIILIKSAESNTRIPLSILCGKVIDKLSQVPLEYANVYVLGTKKGSSSKADGSFQLKTILSDKDTLVISYIGYQEQRFPAKDFLKKPCPTIALDYFEMDDDFIVVTDYLTDGISLHDSGDYTKLDPSKIKPLPGQAEPDVLTSIQFLPGINSTDGTASNISIRGGTSDQNLILWEDIPVYHAAHYFGMISAFNPYIIDKAKVYKGGFDVEHGGRISGLIDLRSEHYGAIKPKFGVGINFINAYTYGKIPILNRKSSITYSIRRSINDWWRSPTFNNITNRIHQGVLLQTPILNNLPKSINIRDKFNFLDANIKGSFRLSDKDELNVAYFMGNNDFEDVIRDDQIRQRQSDTLQLKSSGLSLSWTHDWNPSLSTKLLGVSTRYEYDYDYQVLNQNSNPDKNGRKESKIIEQQIHLLNTYKTPRKHLLKLGYQMTNYDVAYLITKTTRQNSQVERTTSLQSNLHTSYLAFNSNKQKTFGVDAGIRWNYFEKESSSYFEPRVRLWYQASKDLNLYINAGRYYQFLSQLIEIEGDRASIETPVWVLAGNKTVPVLNSSQLLAGMVYRKKSWLLDVQAYYKNINGLTSLAIGFDENFSDNFHLGDAKIKGLDILIKKRWKNYNSWLSYSFSKADHYFDTFLDKEFPSSIDQRHTLDWVNLWSFGKFDCSIGWKLASGKPFSLKENYEVRSGNTPDDSESIRALVREFNSERLPFEHRLDASISYTLQPKKSGDWKAVFGLSLSNIYHQRNIYSRLFFIDNRPNEEATLQYIDRVNMGFTPNLVARFEW